MAEDRPVSTRKAPRTPPRGAGRRKLQLLIFFVACVLVVNALVGDKGLIQSMRARREYDELAAAIASIRHENARLREDARRLREDPRAIEEVARRELGLIRPGEVLFIIKDIPAPGPLPKTHPESVPRVDPSVPGR